MKKQEQNDYPQLFSVSEAAEILGVTEKEVLMHIRNGNILAYLIDDDYKINENWLYYVLENGFGYD